MKRIHIGKLVLFYLGLWLGIIHAQHLSIERVEPPDWWIGMVQDSLQLMLHGTHLNGLKVECNQAGIRIKKIMNDINDNYVFINLQIDQNIAPGEYDLRCSNKYGRLNIKYQLKERSNAAGRYQGFNSRDIIYLITPDRFANGDSTNDFRRNMRDKLDRSSPLGRHGGDIQGIIDKLDYLQDLGVTALWINPLIENDMTISYHGYGATDLYKIDPRFGSNELYFKLVAAAHKHNLKVILDHVSNHVGIEHPWLKNLPMPDWINGSIAHHQLNRHGKDILQDIHGDSALARNTLTGWFVSEMPDLNQKNEFVANYLIQNTLWWIESSGLDGIREDTYPYVDQEYLARWARTILTQYPDFNIVGEVWIQDPVFVAPYQQGSVLSRQHNTYLPCVTDYGLFDAFGNLFFRQQSISNIYHCITHDFLYADPNQLLTFIDNHDVLRLMDLVQGDIRRFKMAIQLLCTLRGIPQIYYGTEIGLRGGPEHGLIRADFPGGFRDSSRNAFTREGRSDLENELFEFTKKMIKLRKNHPALSQGEMIHLPAFDEFYIFFRISAAERIMIVVNNREQSRNLNTALFEHHFQNTKYLLNIENDSLLTYSSGMDLTLAGFAVGMYQLK
jgi:neopullulanase